MKIKETIITEVDDRGQVTRRTRTVETYESNTDRGYDFGTLFGGLRSTVFLRPMMIIVRVNNGKNFKEGVNNDFSLFIFEK